MSRLALVLVPLLAGPALADDTQPVPEHPTIAVTIQPDLRLCAQPLCGGWWYKDVENPLTLCGDGTEAFACYAAEIDFATMEGVTFGFENWLLWQTENGNVLLYVEPIEVRSRFGKLGALRVWDAELKGRVEPPE